MGRFTDSVRSFVLGPYSSRDPLAAAIFGYGPTSSGASVTEWTALNYSAWWAATQIVANAIAAFPLSLYRRLPNGGREQFIGHPLHRVLHRQFNSNQSSFTVRKQMMVHVLSWGNAYAEIERSQMGQPLNLWPITPNRVTPEFNDDGSIGYRVLQPSGRDTRIAAADMLHIKGLAFDDLVGYSVVRKARETIGLGIATEQFGAKFFGNGSVSSMIASHPGKLSKPAYDNLKQSLREQTTGMNQHGMLLLEEGIKVEKTTIPPDDAQFLETRMFGVREVARWFGIPPHKIGDLERATFSNIEEQNLDYYNDCINPWITNWEQEYDRKLIRPLEQTIQYTKHNIDALLRPRALERAQVLEIKMRNSAISADEWRDLDDENPLPDGLGGKYYVPLNMVPVDRIDEVIDKQVAPAPTPAPAAAPTPEPATNGNQPQRAERNAKIITAQRALIIDGMGRMVRREGQAVRRAAKKGPEGVRQWSEVFYPKHATMLRDTLMPAVQQHLTYVAATIGAQLATQRLVDEYIEHSLAELKALPTNELENAVDQMASRWEIQRPPLVADALMTEELSHAMGEHHE